MLAMKRKTAITIFKTLLSLFFLSMLFKLAGTEGLSENIRNINPLFFAASLVLSAGMIALSCLKWKVLLDIMTHEGKNRASYFFLFRSYLVGYFFSNLLPSNIGGDVARVYYAGGRVRDYTSAAVSVFIERLTGLMFLLFLAAFAPLFKMELYRELYVLIPAILSLMLLILIVFILTIRDPVQYLERISVFFLDRASQCWPFSRSPATTRALEKIRVLSDNILTKVGKFHSKAMQASRYMANNKGTLLVVVVLVLGFYVSTWFNVYFAFRAFNIIPDFNGVMALVPLVMLAAMLPISILGNLGFTESVYVTFFSLTGLAPAGIVAMGLFLRFKLFIIGFLGLLSYLTLQASNAKGGGGHESIKNIVKLEVK